MPIIIKEMQYKNREELPVLLQEFDDIPMSDKVEITTGKTDFCMLALIHSILQTLIALKNVRVIYINYAQNVQEYSMNLIKNGMINQTTKENIYIVFLFQKEE